MRHYIKIRKLSLISCLFVVLHFFPAAQIHAQRTIGVSVGSLGFGLNYGVKLNSYITLRGVGHFFALSKGLKVRTHNHLRTLYADIDINLKGRWLSAGALIDFNPFKNWFYLSSGLFYNGNKLDVKAHLDNNEFFLGGVAHRFKPGPAHAEATFKKVVPYLGIGGIWEFENYDLCLNLGVFFQGKTTVKILKIPDVVEELEGQDHIANARNEVQSRINSKWFVKMYPVLSLGLRYRF